MGFPMHDCCEHCHGSASAEFPCRVCGKGQEEAEMLKRVEILEKRIELIEEKLRHTRVIY